MTIKPERKVLGSLTGEIWTTRSAKIARRRLPDGRTETGREIPAGHPEYESEESDEGEIMEIVIEEPKKETPIQIADEPIREDENEGLDWQPATMEFTPDIPDAIPEPPEPEVVKGPQIPKTTVKDIDKIQDLMMGIAALFDNQEYSTEDKALIISRLFADTTDLRVETSQVVISGKMYGIFAAVVSVALLLKGSAGLFGNYGNIFKMPVRQQPKEPDVFGDEHGPD